MIDILDAYELGLSFGKIDLFYQLCSDLEKQGNRGFYPLYRNNPDTPQVGKYFILNKKYKSLRDGIIYYSRGHGWRVRKEPHWETVMLARFPKWTEWKAKQIMDGTK